jgi:3-hydroxyacyl-CoA dehydrogenase/enoyl-CoA hydratase/3-hydroxybutyryl-CoA epimerase
MSTSAVRVEHHDDDIVVLVLDQPGRTTNTMNDDYRLGMDAALAELRELGARLRGVVVTSAKKTFFARGDLKMLRDVRPGDEPAMRDFIGRVTAQLRALETIGAPVVAAINGSALGGLPEVTLGILPAANGLTRTVRLLGIRSALANLLLTGASHTPRQARDLGLVDEVVSTADQLLDRAKAWIATHPNPTAAWDLPGYEVPDAADGLDEDAVRDSLPAAARRVFAGYPLPAPRAILRAACVGALLDFAGAAGLEAEAFIELVCGQISTNLIQSKFFDIQTIRSGGSRPAQVPHFRAARAAVIGAGMMGVGIAEVCARSGMSVALIDVDLAAATRGRDAVGRSLAGAVKAGALVQADADEILERVVSIGDVEELSECDLIVEAVFEDEALKGKILGEVQHALTASASVLASNTSTIPISDLAKTVERPEAFLGLHFFSPVPRMALVEVIAGADTSPETLARGIDIVTRLRKTPIVVSDSRGFFTSRVILTRLVEALAMVAEGVEPAVVENAAVAVGYPVGPLALIDELTVSLVHTVRTQAREASLATGAAWLEHPGDAVAAAMVLQDNRPGRAAGAGFYNYVDGARRGFWPGLSRYLAAGAGVGCDRSVDIHDRLVFAEVVDSFRCLDEGVLRSTADTNVGSLLGIGFPAWTGGVIQFAAGYPGGVDAFGARAAELTERYGERFRLLGSWVEQVGGGHG